MDTPRIFSHDVGDRSLVIDYGLHIDGMCVLPVAVEVFSCSRWHKAYMCAVDCTKDVWEATDCVEPLFSFLLLLQCVREADVAGVSRMMASSTLGKKVENDGCDIPPTRAPVV
ncbi:hypothetical protein NDU88_005145 [Pleurodeles waltl]|uniref:Uncharacterized protein n=1 Tax=Pleurodeles waltl TaxID=8319 RepID=A0AAV7TAF6_PLEWA|nr:hypothetical protein NDU88_005145 [Pleurodeles waltl]